METKNFPRSVQPVEEDGFFIRRRAVKEIRPFKFRALKVGDVYVVAYNGDDGVYHAIVAPGYTVKSYDNFAEAFETLLAVLKNNAGAKIEVVEVEADMYVLEVERVLKSDPSDVATYEERVIEWGAYSIDEDLVTDWP